MSEAYLALKHKAPPGFARAAFHHLTAARLLTKYPHAGIVIDGVLTHATRSHGVHQVPFDPDGWDLFKLPEHEPAIYGPATLDSMIGLPYDTISLLGFVVPGRVSDSRALYCYEVCYRYMTGVNPSFRVTPEMLLVELAKWHGLEHKKVQTNEAD